MTVLLFFFLHRNRQRRDRTKLMMMVKAEMHISKIMVKLSLKITSLCSVLKLWPLTEQAGLKIIRLLTTHNHSNILSIVINRLFICKTSISRQISRHLRSPYIYRYLINCSKFITPKFRYVLSKQKAMDLIS